MASHGPGALRIGIKDNIRPIAKAMSLCDRIGGCLPTPEERQEFHYANAMRSLDSAAALKLALAPNIELLKRFSALRARTW